jgi:hypothetical protein
VPLARPLPPCAAGEGVPELGGATRAACSLPVGTVGRNREGKALARRDSSRTPSPAARDGRGRGRQGVRTPGLAHEHLHLPHEAAGVGDSRSVCHRKKYLTALGEGCPLQVCSSPPNGGRRAAPGASGRSSHALRFSGSARSPTSPASTGTLKGAGNYPSMHPVLALRYLATSRSDRRNPQKRRNPLDPPSVDRFQTRTRGSRTHGPLFFETPP